jgi:hypothetical protein
MGSNTNKPGNPVSIKGIRYCRFYFADNCIHIPLAH